jgi:hypothetical protein
MTSVIKPGTYHLSVHNDVISKELQTRVYDYLLDSEYCVHFYDHSHSLWYPRHNRWEFPRTHPAAPRLPLAWDEISLEHRAPVIFELWKIINQSLDNQYTIHGIPEGMSYMTGISPLSSLSGKPNCAWRVYGDGQEHELRAHSKCVHRDSIDLDDNSNYTLVYFANLEWHPQYYGETVFHSNDADTGDYTGRFEKDQDRGFPIGDIENIVAPRPGRFMLFDSRYLHQIKSTAFYTPGNLMAISFRIKKISHDQT